MWKDLRDVDDVFRLLGQPQDQVMVLAAVKFRAETAAGFLQELLPESGEVADIVVGPQVVRGVVRLEMGIECVLRGFAEGVFVGIDQVRGPGGDDLHHLKEGGRVEQVVVVEQGVPVPGGHADTPVGIAGNAFVGLEFLVLDAGIFGGFAFADPLDVGVGFVAAVSQAELPVRVGLVFDGVQHLDEIGFGCIVEGNQDAELNRIGEGGVLLRCFLLLRQEGFAVELFPDAQFLPVLVDHPDGFLPAVGDPVFDKAQGLPQAVVLFEECTDGVHGRIVSFHYIL